MALKSKPLSQLGEGAHIDIEKHGGKVLGCRHKINTKPPWFSFCLTRCPH